ncbi:MAG: serine/threonine-protein phosphatase [Myxococcales bacterium]|nr:serine/threonine-protein phosphatase [Myxococcales bacterium]
MNPDVSSSPVSQQVPDNSGAFAALGIPTLEVAHATDSGREPSKQVNEDAAYARATAHGHLAVVCDGMGGHVGGREASNLAIQTIFAVFDATPAGVAPQTILGDAIRRANTAIWERGQVAPDLKGMGSTCVAVLTHAGGTEIAHVGDSRVYLLTQQQVFQVTKDHSLVQRLVDANMLTPEQAANHPNANQITNAFGQKPEIEVEIRPQPFPFGAGDTFLLCSDGLSDECGPRDFLEILAPLSPCHVAAQQLVDLANARGGHDNITVILVRFPGGAPFTPAAAANTPPFGTPSATPAMGSVVGQQATVEMETLSPANFPPPGSAPGAPVSVPKFQPPPTYTPTPIEPAAKKSSKGLVLGILFVLLLVAGGVTAAVMMRGDKDEKQDDKSSGKPDEEPSSSVSASGSKKKHPPKELPKPSVDPDPPPSAHSSGKPNAPKGPPSGPPSGPAGTPPTTIKDPGPSPTPTTKTEE